MLKYTGKRGFTLIELVMVIVIVSIVSAMAGMGLVQIAEGYLLAKRSTASAEKVQIALARLAKELEGLEAISAATATSLTYKRRGAGEGFHTLAWTGAGQPLTLDGDTLLGEVHAFSLTYHDGYVATASAYSWATAVIEVTFALRVHDQNPVSFSKRIVI